MRLTTSLFCAAVLHGLLFGVAAAVLSRAPGEAPPPTPLDVDVVEVAMPKPDPMADSAPAPRSTPVRPETSVRRRPRELAPAREVMVLADPAAVAPIPTPSEIDAPVVHAAPVTPPPSGAATRGPMTQAPSAGATISARPRYRTNPKPVYPLPSLRRHEEGVVVLNVVVQPDGLPASVTLSRSSGYPLLDRAALEQVRRTWTFEPGLAAGVPVQSAIEVPVRFDLSEGP